jgi:E3 Ubiquitin ligase
MIESVTNPWVFVAWFGCLCGIYLFGQGLLLLPHRRQASPLTKIADAKAGPILVGGWAEGADVLSSPISGEPCFYFRATLWRQEDPANADSWEVVAEETRGKPFLLSDKAVGDSAEKPGFNLSGRVLAGRILVDPRGANVDLPRDTYEEYGKTLLATLTDIPPGLDAFLKRNKVDASAAVRVEEYLLVPGAEVFVRGVAVANPGLAKSSEPSSLGKNKAPAGKTTTPVSNPVRPEVIRLSPEPPNRPATEMTMQSRVAAALALARARSSEATGPNPLHIPSISVAVAETNPARAKAQAGNNQGLRTSEVTADAAPQRPQPLLVVRQQDGSRFSISYRNLLATAPASIRRASTFLAAGPLVTLASVYMLLTILGVL